MPYKQQHPCGQTGCPNLTHDKYCAAHAPANKRESGGKRSYGSRWQRRRKQYLAAHPLCVECTRHGRLTPATVTDHVVPHRGDAALMWDENNWQPLCKDCHDKKTGTCDSRPAYKY